MTVISRDGMKEMVEISAIVLKTDEVEMIRPRLNAPGEWTPIGTEVPGLAGEFFLVTGSGKYFRNIIVDPEACLAIIELDEKGCNYRIRWGLVEGGQANE